MSENNRSVNAAKKALLVLFEKRESCCGCSACYAVCPVGAVTMEPDEEGFLYPSVNDGKCIRCYRCLSVCAFKADQEGRSLERGGTL